MEKPKKPPDPKRERRLRSNDPEVILDFVLEDEVFFITLRNISSRPLIFVRAKFDPPITGAGGREPVEAWPLFNRRYFLAPGKEIRTFLDTSQAYFARGEPNRISVQLTYRDYSGRAHQAEFLHDLEIYQSVRWLVANNTRTSD